MALPRSASIAELGVRSGWSGVAIGFGAGWPGYRVTMRSLFRVVRSTESDPGPILATAIHAGHDLRPEVASRLVLDEDVRRREEDPYTDRIAAVAATTFVVDRSRFEVDLNRSRDAAVYERPQDAWGLEVWATPLDASLIERSRFLHDEFYAALADALDQRAGRFVVLDVHSYNHCRRGAAGPPDPTEGSPEVNVGTGSLDRRRFGNVVSRFLADLGDAKVFGEPIDVRENVRFRGGYLSSWVHDRYPERGCALALEFKKVFMDEWTGDADCAHIDAFGDALASTFSGLVAELNASP